LAVTAEKFYVATGMFAEFRIHRGKIGMP